MPFPYIGGSLFFPGCAGGLIFQVLVVSFTSETFLASTSNCNNHTNFSINIKRIKKLPCKKKYVKVFSDLPSLSFSRLKKQKYAISSLSSAREDRLKNTAGCTNTREREHTNYKREGNTSNGKNRTLIITIISAYF